MVLCYSSSDKLRHISTLWFYNLFMGEIIANVRQPKAPYCILSLLIVTVHKQLQHSLEPAPYGLW